MKKSTLTISFCLLLCMQVFSQKTVIQDYRYTIHFDTNQDQLTPHAKLKLEKRLANFIQKDIISIEIIGHTDTEGSLDFNMGLSQRRAKTVEQFIQKNEMNRFPISTSFQGETIPNINENSATAKAANRRVEIWWMIREIIPAEEVTIISSVTTYKKIIPDATLPKEVIIPLTDYQKFHQQIDKNAQQFNIDNNTGGILKANEGTIIHFYPNSFCDCKSKENLNGNINISLKEYYSLRDFLQAGLSTQANDKTLQSAGSIHISASVNDKEVCLNDRQDYEILFPKNKINKENYADMQLFQGNLDENGEVNWGVMKRNSLLNKNAIRFANQGYSDSNCINNRTGGDDSDCRGKISFSKRMNMFFKDKNQWKTYRYWRSTEGRKITRQERERYAQELMIRENNRRSIIKNFDGTFSELAQALKKMGINSEEYIFNHYITSANQLNYVNCDRFLYLPKEKLFTVNLAFQEHKNISSKLILRPYNSIARGTPTAKGYYFSNLPKGEKAQIILYDYSGKSPKLAKMNIVIGEAIDTEKLVLKEYSLNDFKELMAVN
jgi:hypothetical protein